jgi:VanZ family protein
MKLRPNWWWAVALYMALIFYLSSIPPIEPFPGASGLDKPEHYIAYGILAFVAALAVWGSSKSWSLLKVAIAAVAIASAYGITDEFHQSFVPSRHCDLIDWVADTLGAISGALIALLVLRLRMGARKSQHPQSRR